MLQITTVLPKRVLWAFVAAVLVSALIVLQRGQRLVPVVTHHPAKKAPAPTNILDDINNSTLGFEKILVVGLPSRTDRRDGMTLQAALSNLDIRFVDGVVGSNVLEKAVPKPQNKEHLRGPGLGSWRGHMNAIQKVVRRNLSSALILEDDCDWDISIRQQLRDFARSAHALTQPLQSSPGSYADPTYPQPSNSSPPTVPDIPFDKLPATVPPKSSPYGEGWDVLWVGHCGMHFPSKDNKAMPKGRVVRYNDMTVPEMRHLWSLNVPFTLAQKYPNHTRAVHHAQDGVCTLGYAVSQRGAQKILYHVGLKEVTDPFDILLKLFCDGSARRSTDMHNCLTTQPGLFHHHRTVGHHSEASDIGDHGDGFRDNAYTDMVRWSVRLNAIELMNGGTSFHDQFPDDS
ncbi:hypothetical protein TOPH_06972 [Tolypocladium ophioglossoides CBS 100239]|uniref:Glycosyl transferase family 25 domain-containing protein n=1 Tax=Tolypocladium ophioglossoides (strain CBS 100239) TaxID=1163406 RepID=A0A0L0N2P7_TOLOC|nr:hypothetical protein TOPH_06972 [Tolypocladium ophioglossoides CBS 100239]